ncbi:Abnormal spindle-like microcephaly-associated [Phytophthora citrophthora]|uniref:Abnormal spindle-like microcephaly-associated n=1 Tax=Phytophthora citrophthora TaxID=4793 RepID=A0AAD9GNG2_9STRA|nr:Abnormal spindle-like microcephaly-associated [Phytophthora citrophthora]
MALSRRNSRLGSTGRSVADSGASPYLHELRRQLSNLGSSQRPRRQSTQTRGPAAEKSSAICSAVQLALLEPLGAVHLEVTDVSCARLQYRLLGTKRYWFRSVKQEKQGKIRWEVKLYYVNCRKSTLDRIQVSTWYAMPRLTSEDVTIKSVGFFDTEKTAMTALEAAVKARDVTNPFTGLNIRKSELPIELVKYFQVVVVSDIFQRKSQNERLDLIYSLLLDAAPSSANSQDDTEMKFIYQQRNTLWPIMRSQLRGFSIVGSNVVSLSIWRSLACHFIVSAKTATQWRAGRSRQEIERSFTERFGLSHLANDRTFNVNQGVLPVSRGLADLVSLNQEELTSKHQTESVPHFYHGLPDEVKRMIAEEQSKMDHGRAASISVQKLTKNTEDAFVKRYLKRRREYLQVAIKLQQLYRSNRHSKALRCCFRRHIGAMSLQRLFRGHQRRKYARAYFRVATCATLIIQSVYRSFKSRQQTMEMFIRYQRATLDLQRVYRGFIGRSYARRVRRLQANAIMVEKLVRGFLGRRRAQRIFLAKHKQQVVIPACVNIQRLWRGYRERKWVRVKRQAVKRVRVFLPAALRIETLIRGFLARRLVTKFRAANEAARVIQKFWRSCRYFRKWMELMELRRKDRMASHIGAIARGILARKFIQREKKKRYHRRVVEPSAAKIQRVFRGYIVRKRLEDIRDQVEAAITLQQMWRSRSTVKTIREKLRGFRISLRESAAGRIQRSYRCYRARQELNFRRLTYFACHGKAALAVQAAWRSYCSRKQLKEFRFCSLIERKASALTQSKEDREMIEFDIFDARADLKRVMKYKAKTLRRIKELREMRIEWERRQPVVEKELSQLTEEDMDRGWGEAFETEKHILHFSLELSVEDILSKKQQVREYEEEIEDLRIELEDLERDVEECVLNETMELESYRDLELQRAGGMFADEKARRVRLQRIRWGTKSVRKHVILRERQDLQLSQKEVLAKRQVEELGLLAFEKKEFVKEKLEQAIEDAARSRAKQNEVIMEMKRDTNVLHGFNRAVEKMKAITQEYSFQFRVPKTDLREDPESVMCSGCGRITCDCHLQNNEPDEGVKKLDTNKTITNMRSTNRLARRWRYQD